jgi:predicted nucleic acid-binding protein
MKSYKPRITVDTSAIVKWFKIEDGRERALKLRNWAEAAKIKLAISTILLSECARGLKKAGWEDTEIYESLDEHHIKQGLKEEMKKKAVEVLRLSEIGRIEEKF